MHPPNRRRQQHPVNRRRPRPSQTRTAARRHGQRLEVQLRRLGSGLASLGSWLCALPRTIHDTLAARSAPDQPAPASPPTWDRPSADFTAEFTETDPPRAWDRPSADLTDPKPRVWDRHRFGDPTPGTTAASGDQTAADPSVPGDVNTWEHRRSPRPAESGSRPADRTIIRRIPPVAPTASQPPQPEPLPAAQPTTRTAVGNPAAAIGRRLIPQATALGRQIAPRAAQFGRQLGPLARRGATMTGRGMRAAGRRIAELRPLLRLLRRFLAAVGEGTMHLGALLARVWTALRHGLVAGVVRRQAVLFGLLTRAMWWSALVLLLLGGQALLEIHGRAPLDQRALPAFALGLGLCALLVTIAAQARLRWAALVLGFSHGGLLALVWVVAAAIH
ncbi:MAG: hypothetical protein JNL82_13080 [Myxococcales bacterium]|nr:hypothetical protein [Myxococcales bacterium]